MRGAERGRGDIPAAQQAAAAAAAAPPTDAEVDEPTPSSSAAVSSSGRGALLVGAGIFLSRIAGLVRGRVLAHYLGIGDASDAFTAAVRAPNFLQNLLGEGALSASFIPVYAAHVNRGEREEAGRLAGGVAALLALAVSVLVLVGVLVAPWLVALFFSRFPAEKQALTVQLIRILFPGTGFLVMSAWCLGILNSHRRFLLSYAAPVIWNAAIIVALIMGGVRGLGQSSVAVYAAWGSLVGSALQVLVQLPSVLRLVTGLRFAVRAAGAGLSTVTRNFLPALLSRGVVQLSAWFDQIIAAGVASGGLAALGFAQQIYTLPVSLFGMSISAAELPAMSGVAQGGDETVFPKLRARLDAGLRRMAFFVIPSAVAFVALGDVIAGALFQTGSFDRSSTQLVWGILAGSGLGLVAATMGRLYSSTFYALRDTRTPVRFAATRVAISIVLGFVAALYLPRLFGVDPKWGVGGLTLASSLAGWVEYELLRRALDRRIGPTGLAASYGARVWGIAIVAALAGLGVKLALGRPHPIVVAALVLGAFGLVYLAGTVAAGLPEATAVFGKISRIARRGRRRP